MILICPQVRCGGYVSEKTDIGGKNGSVNKIRWPLKFQKSVLLFRFWRIQKHRALTIAICDSSMFFVLPKTKKNSDFWNFNSYFAGIFLANLCSTSTVIFLVIYLCRMLLSIIFLSVGNNLSISGFGLCMMFLELVKNTFKKTIFGNFTLFLGPKALRYMVKLCFGHVGDFFVWFI